MALDYVDMSRREQNKAEKDLRIMAAAEHLLRTQGYRAMTMAQVATMAGVAVGTVFQYAASKPELMLKVALHSWAQWLPGVMRSAHRIEDPVERGRLVMGAILKQAESDYEWTRQIVGQVLFGEPGRYRTQMQEAIHDTVGVFGEALVDAGADPAAAQWATRVLTYSGLTEVSSSVEHADGLSGRALTQMLDERIGETIERLAALCLLPQSTD